MILLHIGDKPFRRATDSEDLSRRGIHRTQVHSEADALEHLAHTQYDIVFLDLDAPAFCGPDVVTAIRRANHRVPIFAFTSRVDLRLKVAVLDLGADDVMTQLCPMDELLARMRAVLRRLDGHATSTMTLGPLEVFMDSREVHANGTPVPLSPTEYRLVELLVRRQGAPVTKDACLAYLYNGRDEPDLKMIDVVACRVRKKFATVGLADMMKNVWGHGFKLEVERTPKGYQGMGRRRTDAPGRLMESKQAVLF